MPSCISALKLSLKHGVKKNKEIHKITLKVPLLKENVCKIERNGFLSRQVMIK